MTWTYHTPTFEYRKSFDDRNTPWVGHIHFGYDFVRNCKPHKIVELGTFKGTSSYAFLQALKDDASTTSFTGVDLWEGDKHAGFYDNDVYTGVQNIVREHYSTQNAILLRKTFDDALDDVDDHSIDLLHIDGLHTYDAVQHDFTSWLPKLTSGATVLFHDIKVMEDDFGVYRFWLELQKEYPTMEFYHSFGLGVLFFDKNRYDNLVEYGEEWKMHYGYKSEIDRIEGIRAARAAFDTYRKTLWGIPYKMSKAAQMFLSTKKR